MTTLVALLRAVNVGGTGALPMKDLTAACARCGFSNVVTVLQSGNVAFSTTLAPPRAQAALARELERTLKAPVHVLVRTVEELRKVLDAQPFSAADPAKVIVHFFDAPLAKGALDGVKGRTVEELEARGRELFVHYPAGQGRSKLKVPRAHECTGRNLNTLRKILDKASAKPFGGA